jgi:hypothetical protein
MSFSQKGNIMAATQAFLQFRRLTDAAVRGALSDPDADNPIAAELSRLVMGYMDNFARQAQQPRGLPPAALRMKGTCPIENVALQIVLEEIAGAANKNS